MLKIKILVGPTLPLSFKLNLERIMCLWQKNALKIKVHVSPTPTPSLISPSSLVKSWCYLNNLFCVNVLKITKVVTHNPTLDLFSSLHLLSNLHLHSTTSSTSLYIWCYFPTNLYQQIYSYWLNIKLLFNYFLIVWKKLIEKERIVEYIFFWKK